MKSYNEGANQSQNNGQHFSDIGSKHGKWYTRSIVFGNFLHIHHRQVAWTSLGPEDAALGNEEDHLTSEQATHVETTSAQEPNLGESKHALFSRMACYRRLGGERPYILEGERNDCERVNGRMVDVEYDGKGEFQDVYRQSDSRYSKRKNDRVHFEDEDHVVGWTNEKIIKVPYYGEDMTHQRQMARRNTLFGGFDGTSDCRDWIPQDRRSASKPSLDGSVALSDRLVEVHPEPAHIVLSSCSEEDSDINVDALEQQKAKVTRAGPIFAYREKEAAVERKFVSIREGKAAFQAKTARSSEWNIRTAGSEAKFGRPVHGKRVNIWHADYNSAAWRVPRDKKHSPMIKESFHKYRLRRFERRIADSKADEGSVSSRAAIIEMFGYGVAAAVIFVIIGWLAGCVNAVEIVHPSGHTLDS
jgi:hypothetical protein